MALTGRILAGALVAAGLFLVAAGSAFPSSGGVREHRLECFELRGEPGGPPLGFASLHRSDEPGATQLEWQILFHDSEGEGDIQVWHVETHDGQGRRWVWRERAAEDARSLVVESSDDCLELVEWGQRTALRQQLSVPANSFFPLELCERLREGEPPAADVALLDPLSNSIEQLRLVTLPAEHAPGAPESELRRYELLRADGSLFAAWTFLGKELVGFQWQRDGLVAVRVEAERVVRRTIATGFSRPSPEPAQGR